ncbi:MAG: DUF2162 domain-containing protein [Candidatus Loosdrechtia sp.]|uniref:DUF2162 domain-containing protein n=1 Tax=Candidatus Loosdrechtia sp. TaxID=3101272 RepID=UPI003A5D23AF|nr:MAG: DUF2162 domain-containing protein [Candidatus Jettenia sp. AMX2]
MDLNIILWYGGIFVSLGIFAIKAGIGISFSGIRWKGIASALSTYLILFVLIVILLEQLMKILEPALKKGPFLHVIMAMGMIAWGITLLRRQKTKSMWIRSCEDKNISTSRPQKLSPYSLLLMTPCPICLVVMICSTWAMVNVVRLPSILVGLGLGAVFGTLTLTVVLMARLKQKQISGIGLGLSMIVVGFYFIASLFLPAKIEDAKGVYQSFLTEGGKIEIDNKVGVLALLLAALVAGYFANKKRIVSCHCEEGSNVAIRNKIASPTFAMTKDGTKESEVKK